MAQQVSSKIGLVLEGKEAAPSCERERAVLDDDIGESEDAGVRRRRLTSRGGGDVET